MQPYAISARRCAACPMADALLCSRAAAHDPVNTESRHFTPILGPRLASYSPQASTAASMPATAPASIRGSRSSTGFRNSRIRSCLGRSRDQPSPIARTDRDEASAGAPLLPFRPLQKLRPRARLCAGQPRRAGPFSLSGPFASSAEAEEVRYETARSRRSTRNSATGFMNLTRCKRSRLRAQSRIRRNWSNRPPWPPFDRPFPPTGPCSRNVSHRTAFSRMRSSRQSFMRAKRMPKCSRAVTALTKPRHSEPREEDDTDAVQFRKGFFLGDGTGSGKGRQAAGVILDNWLKGAARQSGSRSPISSSRTRSATGPRSAQEKLLIVPQSRYRQGTPIRIAEGILFTTYATLTFIGTRRQSARASSKFSTGLDRISTA